MRVALYARVSKDEHEKDARYQDPENQLVALRQYCKARDWEVVSEYVDRLSGADPNRPEFKKVMSEYWTKNYQAIVVWKFDRFSREPLFVSMSYIERLKLNKIGLISMTESWLDTRQDNPMGELVIAIMAWASAEERRKISERTKAGIAQRRAIGQWKGGRHRKDCNCSKHRNKRGGVVTTEAKQSLNQTDV